MDFGSVTAERMNQEGRELENEDTSIWKLIGGEWVGTAMSIVGVPNLRHI